MPKLGRPPNNPHKSRVALRRPHVKKGARTVSKASMAKTALEIAAPYLPAGVGALASLAGGAIGSYASSSKNETVVTGAGNRSKSSTTVVHNGKRKKLTELQKIYTAVGNQSTYETIATVGLAGGEQQQSSQDVTYMYDQTTLETLYQACLNTNSRYTNSTLNTSGNASIKLYAESLISNLELSNQSVAACTLDIYDCVAKVSSNNATFYGPTLCWNRGILEEDFTSGNILGGGIYTGTSLFPYAVPTTSRMFNQYWKIVKRTTVEMDEGTSHSHVFNFSPHKIIDTQDFNQNPMIKGLTCCHFIVARGSWADSSQNSAIGTIVLTPVKLVGCSRQKYITRMISNNFRTYEQYNNVPFVGNTTGAYIVTEAGQAPLNAFTTFG